MNTEKDKIENTEKNLKYFDTMVNAVEKITNSWKIVLILTNLFWAIVLSIFIFFAYLNPAEYEYYQNQDFKNNIQTQESKGSN